MIRGYAVFFTPSVPCGSLGVVPASLTPHPLRVIRARWKESDYRVARVPQRVRKDGPRVAPGGKVYGEWLAALVDEFGPRAVAGWPADRELPSEWRHRVWTRRKPKGR